MSLVSKITGRPFVLKPQPEHVPEQPIPYSESVADRFCELIMSGEYNMIGICKMPGMPTVVQVCKWLKKHPEFAVKYYAAKELLAEVVDAKIADVADSCVEENTHSSQVKIKAYQWRASKMAPKKYGEKLELGGDQNNPLVMTVNAARVLDEKVSRLIQRRTDDPSE